MYTPPFNAVHDEAAIREMVTDCRSAWLVTADGGLPAATLLPVMWRGDVVVTHMAKANPHWRTITDGIRGLLIAGGPEAYVSPSWYAAKAEHGKVVPTWNYAAVQLTGTVRVHHDPEWLRRAVTDLTAVHEAERTDRWQVTDAPTTYIDAQLHGIVGIEFTVTSSTGKAKLSQNRSDADQDGVVTGLRDDAAIGGHLSDANRAGAALVADAMAARHAAGTGGAQP